jgi:hypothetical protein
VKIRRRKSDAGHPSAKDVAEVASGRASSGDKREMHGYAVRHPHSAAAKALRKAGYKPRYKLRKKRRKR